jgi:hypothetical protein
LHLYTSWPATASGLIRSFVTPDFGASDIMTQCTMNFTVRVRSLRSGAAARRYIEKHTARLTAFGIGEVRSRLFKTNDPLSRIGRAPL